MHSLEGTGSLTVSGSADFQLALSSGASEQSGLSISGNGVVDLTNNHFFVNYGAAADPINSIFAYIKSGYSGGTWSGAGITSSTAHNNSLSYGIGFADSADPGNPAGLSSGQIEIAYTLLGDANLDYKVNGTDFTLMAANFNHSVTNGWDKGDFNYSGTVNGEDFVLLADNFNQFASQSSVDTADLLAMQSFAQANGLTADVPEPASGVMFIITGAGVLSRRRRRCGNFPRDQRLAADVHCATNGFVEDEVRPMRC